LPPTIGINIFDDYINKIYVPGDSLSSYKIATNWSSYSSKIFAYYILQFLDYDDITVSSNQNVLYNNVSVQPTDPVREGFTFAGWYTNKTYSQSFVFGNAVTQDTTIYAKFTTIAKLNIEGSEIEEEIGYDYTWVYIWSSILFISVTLFTIFLIKNIKRKKF